MLGNTRRSRVGTSMSPWTPHQDKMKIISSDSKGKLERSGKGLITSLGFETKVTSQKYKKTGYAIGNVSKKDLSKIIREFEIFEKLTSEKKRSKHDPTDS